MYKLSLCFILYFLFTALTCAQDIPEFQGDVFDEADILTEADRESLKNQIKNLREYQNVWMAIFVAKDDRGMSIEDLAEKTFKKWKLGQKKIDQGLLFVWIPSKRKLDLKLATALNPFSLMTILFVCNRR